MQWPRDLSVDAYNSHFNQALTAAGRINQNPTTDKSGRHHDTIDMVECDRRAAYGQHLLSRCTGHSGGDTTSSASADGRRRHVGVIASEHRGHPEHGFRCWYWSSLALGHCH